MHLQKYVAAQAQAAWGSSGSLLTAFAVGAALTLAAAMWSQHSKVPLPVHALRSPQHNRWSPAVQAPTGLAEASAELAVNDTVAERGDPVRST
jgi:hypothetical protein